MLLYPVGIIIAIAAMWASVVHLQQDVSSYYDLVAILVVFGGTFAVAVVTLPWGLKKDLTKGFLYLIGKSTANQRLALNESLHFYQSASGGAYKAADKRYLYQQILDEGFELVSLGLPKEKIESILTERVVQYVKRQKRVANAIRGLSKYPPAFGLMGTVLGLVNVMTGVSTGADGKQTAIKMALALVATMYGLIVANLVINPAGELILKRAIEEESQADMAIMAVLLVAEKVSALEAQETLNSFVSEEDRVSLISGYEEAV